MQLINIAAYVFIIIPAFVQDAAIYNTNAASIEDLASDGMVSLLESMIHSIGLLNCNNNNNAFALKSIQPYSAIKIQFPMVSLIR